ncbi:unnamed protein product [Angiostrongylus costaricensis]|uniref:Uncharacterized protein n=1 Tax=Angiostrongylus costaricensis TaxID=334426 RepID=A0A0R3Q125_ANGCS|nr:unnamed protein product [Angiostrongylus costaricensis]
MRLHRSGLPPHSSWEVFLSVGLRRTAGGFVPPTGSPKLRRSPVDSIIRQCFQTLCKDWMSECHWYCDAVKDQVSGILTCRVYRSLS